MRIGFHIETREIANRALAARHVWIVLVLTRLSVLVSRPRLGCPSRPGLSPVDGIRCPEHILVFIAIKIEYGSYREERRKEWERKSEGRNRYSKMVLSWIARLVE